MECLGSWAEVEVNLYSDGCTKIQQKNNDSEKVKSGNGKKKEEKN